LIKKYRVQLNKTRRDMLISKEFEVHVTHFDHFQSF
jgi:hypothetical protein